MFSVYPFPMWWLREYRLCFIIIIKSEVWTIIHCLGLRHETMVCAVCLSIFLLQWNCISIMIFQITKPFVEQFVQANDKENYALFPLAVCERNPPVTDGSPYSGPIMLKAFSCLDVLMPNLDQESHSESVRSQQMPVHVNTISPTFSQVIMVVCLWTDRGKYQ